MMNAIELLQATRDHMGSCGAGIGSALWTVWQVTKETAPNPVSRWNDACRALVAYIDPYLEGVSSCRLYGYVRTFERQATFHTQIDAIDFAIDLLQRTNTTLDSVIDPRD